MAAAIRSIKVGASGRTVCVYFEDSSTHADVNITAVDLTPAPTITISGGSGTTVDLDTAIWGLSALDNHLSYVLFLLDDPITAGAPVTFSALSGWATTSAGAAPASSTATVANPSTGRSYLPVFDPDDPRTMPTGYNVTFPHYFESVLQYANAMKGSQEWTAGGGATIAVNGSGDLTSVTGGYAAKIISRNDVPNAVDSRGYPSDPPGTWTLKWDGADTTIQLIKSGDGTLTLTGETLTGTTDNIRTYLLTHSTNPAESYYTGVQLKTTATTHSNVRVYPPGQPTDGSVKWHSDFLRILDGTKSIRFMDAAAINSSNIVDLADWCGTAERTYGAGPPGRQRSCSVTAAGPYSATDKGLFAHPTNASWQKFKITTSPAHGLLTGHVVRFTGMSGLVNNAAAGTYDLEGRTGVIYVIDTTHFAVSLFMGTAAPVDTTLTGTAIADLSGAMPIADMCDLCNVVGADMWFNVPHLMADAAVTSAATAIAGALGAGLKCRVEYSNEHWNLGAAFEQSRYFYMLMASHSDTVVAHAYARRAAEVHALFLTAFTAVGRAADLVRVFAGQSSFYQDGGPTYEVATWLNSNSKPMDEFAIAPYFTGGPTWNGSIGWDAEWDAMTIEQVMDASEMSVLDKEFANVASRHKAQITARGFPDARVSCYEGGMEKGVGAGTGSISKANTRKWGRHPRIRGVMQRYIQQLQDDGCSLYVDYTLAHPVVTAGNFAFMWGRYNWTTQLAGKGDGSDGLFDNRTNYDDLTQIVSPLGLAIDEWEGLVEGGGGTPTAATAFTFSGPGGGGVDADSTNFTISPNGVYSGSVTISLSGGGLSGTIVRSWTASSAPKTFTIHPTTGGTVTLVPTNSASLTNPSARIYNVTSPTSLTSGDLENIAATVIAKMLDYQDAGGMWLSDVRKANGNAVTLVNAVDSNLTRVNGTGISQVNAVDANLVSVMGAGINPTPGPVDANVMEVLGDPVDPAPGPVEANLTQVKGADFVSQELLASIMVSGTIADSTPAAANLDLSSGLSSVDGFYVGSVMAFSGGALKGLARRITSYTGSTRNVVFAAPFPVSPANGDPFVIFGRID